MVFEKSDRTIRGITAKELLHIHPNDLEALQRYGFTLAQPISIQISAKAARVLILQLFGLSDYATIGFVQKTPQVWFRDNYSGELPIEPLCQLVVARARELAEAIGSQVTAIQYHRCRGQEPTLMVSMVPTG